LVKESSKMKKLLLIGAVAIGAISLAGCGYTVGSTVEDGAWKVIGEHGHYDMLRDLKTGCVYIESTDGYEITPYYGEDGKVVGCGQKNFDEDKYK
jgi:predicted small secreted protein